MKFLVNYSGKCGRLGVLSDMCNREGETFLTPFLTMYTRGGNVPHITHEVLQLLTKENLLMHMPLPNIMTVFPSIGASGQSVSEFVGLKEYPSYVTPQDPGIETPSGYNKGDQIAAWTKNGKRTVDPLKYMNMVEKLKPDIYLALCDGDTDSDSSKKRVLKSMTRTSKLFRECYNHHKASAALQSVAILAPIEGGYDLNARRTTSEEMAGYDVDGYVFDGFHTNGATAEIISCDTLEPLVRECLERLPKDKLRVIHGAWHPATLIRLVALGCDVFDTSLPYLSTERGSALVFPFTDNMSQYTPLIDSLKISEKEKISINPPYEISMDDDVHKEVFQPILMDCSCLACKQHTRAYIHHLLTSQELLGKVLLMIHNLHHYLEFFRSIRTAIKNDSLDALHHLVQYHRRPL
ncbi:Queuine tRNA-ribosyltransferase accessory subunit 2 [Frankliniella fusca]|uniref:Queuine tRNA-ribosyltransferase accessory subunit 2 n=1 Tax=Frankliniella fusca TaxID=407009 RepID=A0AAE1HEX9_9NEOP|nr:Queuine tRNA-ribosyltransferase accessory subunit 2 [Frankliniella fusca]